MDALPLRAFRMAGCCHSGRNRPKALQLRRDGSHCRLADDLDPGSAAQRPHLGLSLLLVARRLFCRAGAEPAWGDTHNGRLSSLHIINIAALGKDRRLRPVYAIVPGVPLPEREIGGLRGYRGMGPVRIGNLAERQVQNDVYGSVVLAAAQMFFDRRLPRTGDTALFARLEELGQWAAVSAFEPDASLWEFRGRARVHTFSSAMCWAACDRLAKIAGILGLSERVSHWRTEADRIRATILDKAWDPEQNTFVESLGGKDVDASLLLLQEIGFVAASDPRFLGTIAAVEKRLRNGCHIFRYTAPDDFGAPTVAFTVCTLWYVNALAAVGRRHVGLLSEDVDPKTGELWGNFPQTYSMVGLIISATRLSRTWEEAFWRG